MIAEALARQVVGNYHRGGGGGGGGGTMTTPPSGSNFLLDCIGPFIFSALGGGAGFLFDAARKGPLVAAVKKGPAVGKLLFGGLLGGGAAAVGGTGSHFVSKLQFEKKMNTTLVEHKMEIAAWNSTLVHLTERFNEKAALLNEKTALLENTLFIKDTHLNDTKTSLQGLQQHYDGQHSIFLGISMVLLSVVLVLVMICLYQNWKHSRERHEMAVAYHLLTEKSLKEKLQQQQLAMTDQKESLVAAIEEQNRQQSMMYRAAPQPLHSGLQPLVLTLPSSFAPACSPKKERSNRV